MALRDVSGLHYLLTDHLGSVVAVLNAGGVLESEQRYLPFGQARLGPGISQTDSGYTGQRLLAAAGVYDYNTRWYSPSIRRFLSADSLVPEVGNPQALDRYAYVSNNPLRYSDQSGHCWGPASFIRGLPGYRTTYNNLDMALLIVQHDNATFIQKTAAAVYIAEEAVAHGALAVGTAALGCAAVAGCATAAEGALGIGSSAATIACADGNCNNEADAITRVGEVGINRALRLWNRVTNFRGVRVYQRNDLINPELTDALGRTNTERMQSGLAPIGPDKYPINLHHMLQNAGGPIAEVTQTFHQLYSKVIHINPNTIPSGIDRTAFDA